MDRKGWMASARGFSLIELLVVLSILLTVAAISVPNLLRSKMAANAAAAVETLRTLNTTEATYWTAYGVGYSAGLAQLGPPAVGIPVSPAAADLIDGVLAGGTKTGYQFLYTPTAGGTGGYRGYKIQANPLQPGESGTSYYYTDQSQVIRVNRAGLASSTDAPIPQ